MRDGADAEPQSKDRRRACPTRKASLTRRRRRVSLPPCRRTAVTPPSTRPIAEPSISETSTRTSLQAVKYLAPDSRGFRQPSTQLHHRGGDRYRRRFIGLDSSDGLPRANSA